MIIYMRMSFLGPGAHMDRMLNLGYLMTREFIIEFMTFRAVAYSEDITPLEVGSHTFVFTGIDKNGFPLPKGLYFYRITCEDTTIVLKIHKTVRMI